MFDLHVSWLGKHTLFRPPLGFFMRRVGGIPVVRHKRGQLVAEAAKLFAERDALALVVPAEGTRGRAERWKSGFYRIAEGAGVPIVCGYLDYARRRGGFGLTLRTSGDVRADMDRIRGFYADKVGRYPENFGPVRLQEEG